MLIQCTPWYTVRRILWKGETKAIYYVILYKIRTCIVVLSFYFRTLSYRDLKTIQTYRKSSDYYNRKFKNSFHISTEHSILREIVVTLALVPSTVWEGTTLYISAPWIETPPPPECVRVSQPSLLICYGTE